MTETIGKVTLNLDKYPGEDYYCDGSVEDEILEIVKKYSTVEYDRIIAERKSDQKDGQSAGSRQRLRSHYRSPFPESRIGDLRGSLKKAQSDQCVPAQ